MTIYSVNERNKKIYDFKNFNQDYLVIIYVFVKKIINKLLKVYAYISDVLL